MSLCCYIFGNKFHIFLLTFFKLLLLKPTFLSSIPNICQSDKIMTTCFFVSVCLQSFKLLCFDIGFVSSAPKPIPVPQLPSVGIQNPDITVPRVLPGTWELEWKVLE